jgi:hypothetical protein
VSLFGKRYERLRMSMYACVSPSPALTLTWTLTDVPLQIFLHYGEEAYVKARAQGLSVGKAYYMPSQVGSGA